MMKNPEQTTPSFKINLATLEGDGSLLCPKCGMRISPEDETEENYKVVDTKTVNNRLDEIVVACGKCRSIITLTGFQQIKL
jgi:hypothetical protein